MLLALSFPLSLSSLLRWCPWEPSDFVASFSLLKKEEIVGDDFVRACGSTLYFLYTASSDAFGEYDLRTVLDDDESSFADVVLPTDLMVAPHRAKDLDLVLGKANAPRDIILHRYIAHSLELNTTHNSPAGIEWKGWVEQQHSMRIFALRA